MRQHLVQYLIQRRWWVGALTVIIAIGAGTLGVAGIDHVESRRAFCVSCHLPDGTPLHEFKGQLGEIFPPVDGTAVHFQSSKDFSCAECHKGSGLKERAKVLGGSFKNTLRYFFGHFEEPEKLNFSISNATCTNCHTPNLSTIQIEKFHGIKAHRYPFPVECTACHLAHGKQPSREAFLVRESAVTMKVCGACHDVNPPTKPVAKVVKSYHDTRKSP